MVYLNRKIQIIRSFCLRKGEATLVFLCYIPVSRGQTNQHGALTDVSFRHACQCDFTKFHPLGLTGEITFYRQKIIKFCVMTDDSKFAIVSPKSVKLYAEIFGVQNLTDDLAGSLAEDVTYRLRETLQVQLNIPSGDPLTSIVKCSRRLINLINLHRVHLSS